MKLRYPSVSLAPVEDLLSLFMLMACPFRLADKSPLRSGANSIGILHAGAHVSKVPVGLLSRR